MDGVVITYNFDPRFTEVERYDPVTDATVVRFMATTEFGTFHVERECPPGARRRETRKRFAEQVIALMDLGTEPSEVELD